MQTKQTKNIPYTFMRHGYYYFSRRVPSDLLFHHDYHRIVHSLRTKHKRTAITRASSLAAQLDVYWANLRLSSTLPTGHTGSNLIGARVVVDYSDQSILTLEDALVRYLEQKGRERDKAFQSGVRRSYKYLVDFVGNKKLPDYSRNDALVFRQSLTDRGLVGSSVARVFTSISAIFNFAISELALEIKNPFKGVYINKKAGTSKRQPIPNQVISMVQNRCRDIDDEVRLLIALISDTGMRLSEAAGLYYNDIELEAEYCSLSIKPNEHRRLKTESSNRTIPLVGASHWAATRLMERRPSCFDEPVFQRYNKFGYTNSNSASAALNKWLKHYVPHGCTIHSFRHSMRDRLRAVECPSDLIDQIGGWSHSSIGQSYGLGYALPLQHKYMNAITLDGKCFY